MSLVHTPAPEGWISRAEYRQWAEGRPGRFERLDGRVVAMAPERLGHTRIKGSVFAALRAAVMAARLPCEVLVDGPTIEVGDSDYQPDVILRCGDAAPSDDLMVVADPLVVVEVLSPSTRHVDASRKLVDYFQIGSVQHSLIVFADRVRAVHHRRVTDGIATRILGGGPIELDPPGITVELDAFYRG